MAYGVKWRTEFTDNEGEDWRVDILEDSYAGAINSMQAAGEPLMFDWPSDGDDAFLQNIRGSAVTINIYDQSGFSYSELFTSDNLEYKVNIYHDTTTLFWTGWVTADTWNEPYEDTPYVVSISAVDGLGLLRDFEFSTLSLTTRQSFSKLIYDIIGTIGFASFTEFINVYASTMSATVNDSPFDQSGADPMLWDEMTRYEALSDILKMFSAGIRQENGALIIYRYKELSDATMYGRIFTSATAKSSTTRTPAQYINRTTTASNFQEVGGSVMISPQLKMLNINQNYGARESILINHDFDFYDFTGSGVSWDIANWTEGNVPDPRPIGLRVQGENYGVYLNSVRSTDTNTVFLEQSVNVLTSATDGFSVSFEYGARNTTGGSLTGTIQIEVSILEGATRYYFTGFGWNATPTKIPTSGGSLTVGIGDWSGWQSYYKAITTSKTGPLRVRLFAMLQTGGSALYAAFRNVKIQFSNINGIIAEGANYEITNAVNGRILDVDYNTGDGDDFDNVIVMERGALHLYSGATPIKTTRSWSTRGGSEADPIIELIGGELGNQFSRPKQIIDLDIYERNNGFLSLIGHLQDDLNKYSAVNRKFVINSANYDVKNRLWKLSLNELI